MEYDTELDDFSYTKLLAVVYVALRSYDMMVPPQSESKEHEKRSKEMPQVNENYSFFTVGPFSKLGRSLFVLFTLIEFIDFLLSQSRLIINFVVRSTGIDASMLQRWFDILPDTHIPYSSTMFQWNGIGDIVAVALCMLAMEIRAWSMRELGRFFTFKLGVSKDQKIVQTGPYHYIRHPSYTGLILMILCCVYLIIVPTLRDTIRPVVITLLEIIANQNELNDYLAQTTSSLIWLLNDQFACHVIGLLISSIIVLSVVFVIVFVRLPQEEKMLHESFGEEWSKFAATRARIVPYIY
jgi:protein-S-isoprenylcysteine O-methyltransferase Ste14